MGAVVLTRVRRIGRRVEVQLRRYRIKQGRLDQFIAEWKAGVVPLRQTFGFTFLGAWSLPESSEFVWVIGDESLNDADRAHYESKDRKQLTPNRSFISR